MSNPEIQATTTNTFGLPATPAVDLTPTGHLPYLVAQADIAREHADALSTLDFDKVTAAVHQAMQKTLPAEYTPALANTIAADMVARLTPATPACPDGITWCLGDPANHADPREHRHEGREHSLAGSYIRGGWTEGVAAFQLVQWDDDEPRLAFQSDGTWPDLTLTQVDELIGDAVPWLTQLIATRRRLAIEVSPNRSTVPFTESDDEQTASAGFDLATRAMDIALDKSEDRAGTLRALRNFLDMAEAEQA